MDEGRALMTVAQQAAHQLGRIWLKVRKEYLIFLCLFWLVVGALMEFIHMPMEWCGNPKPRSKLWLFAKFDRAFEDLMQVKNMA